VVVVSGICLQRAPWSKLQGQAKEGAVWSCTLRVFAVDVYSSQQKLPHIGRVVALPDDAPSVGGLPPYIIINWMVPNYAPSGMLSSSRRTNGPGWNLVQYARISETVQQQLRDSAAAAESSHSAAIQLLRRFMHPTEGEQLRAERLKCILGLADTERTSLGMVLKQMILRYNFKPFLSKTASFCYLGERYFEIDIDIHTWGHSALTAFATVKEKLSSLLLRGAVVVEADADDEMPEQVLAAIMLTQIDPRGCAVPFDTELAAYLADPNTHVPPLARKRGPPGSARVNESRPHTPPEPSEFARALRAEAPGAEQEMVAGASPVASPVLRETDVLSLSSDGDGVSANQLPPSVV